MLSYCHAIHHKKVQSIPKTCSKNSRAIPLQQTKSK